jgi:hypothetical protein
MEDQVKVDAVLETASEVVTETPAENTGKTKTRKVKTVVKKAKARKKYAKKNINPIGNGWTFPVGLVRNKWYLAMYFADSTPYTVIFDGFNFRDCYGKLIPIPSRVKPVDVFVPQTEDKE